MNQNTSIPPSPTPCSLQLAACSSSLPRLRAIASTGGLICRLNGLDYHLLQRALPQIDADGVEFMLYGCWLDQMDEVTRTLRSIPVRYTGLHVEKSIGECLTVGNFEEAYKRFQVNCNLALALHVEHMVLHLWNGPLSDSCMENNIKGFETLQRMADVTGIPLSVENVICNQQDPLTHMRTLLQRYPDIQFTFDTKMAQFHRQLERFYAPECAELWPHITHLHINDTDTAYRDYAHITTLHPGEGDIDWTRFFTFLKTTGYRGDLVCEAFTWDAAGNILPDKMNETIAYLREQIRLMQRGPVPSANLPSDLPLVP